MPSQLTVKPQGQTLVVKVLNASGSAPTVYTTSALSATHTMPKTITADTDFFFARSLDGTAPTITVTRQKDGKQLYARAQEVHPDKPVVVSPEPSDAQRLVTGGGGNGTYLANTFYENFPRYLPVTNGSVLSTGRMSLMGVHLDKGTVVNSFTFLSATTALSAGTNQWAALYDGTAAGPVLLAQTPDGTSTAWSANSTATFTLATPFTTTYSGLHYVGLMVKGTVPTLHSYTGSTVSTSLTPVLTGTSDSSLTDTAPNPATAPTATAVIPWLAIG